MPSRVMRGDFLGSESMSRVSEAAELMFAKLILACDDFGRLDARPLMLRSTLFPMRPSVTVDDIVARLAELTEGEDPPVALYVVGNRPYLFLPGWEKHRGKSTRAAKSKCPDPPAENELRPSPDILGNLDSPPVGRESRVERRGAGNDPPPPTSTDAETELDLPRGTPTLPLATINAMIAARPNGVLYSASDVSIWFASKAPHMELAGRKNLVRTARSWWRRVQPGEVADSRQWLRDCGVRDAANRLRRTEGEVADGGGPSGEELEKIANALHSQPPSGRSS